MCLSQNLSCPIQGSVWSGFQKSGVSGMLPSPSGLFSLWFYVSISFFYFFCVLECEILYGLVYAESDLNFKIIIISLFLLRQKTK